MIVSSAFQSPPMKPGVGASMILIGGPPSSDTRITSRSERNATDLPSREKNGFIAPVPAIAAVPGIGRASSVSSSRTHRDTPPVSGLSEKYATRLPSGEIARSRPLKFESGAVAGGVKVKRVIAGAGAWVASGAGRELV